MPNHYAREMHAALTAYVKANGLRQAGRNMGDAPGQNTHAMRLHRMLESPWGLINRPFVQIINTWRLLGLHLPRRLLNL